MFENANEHVDLSKAWLCILKFVFFNNIAMLKIVYKSNLKDGYLLFAKRKKDRVVEIVKQYKWITKSNDIILANKKVGCWLVNFVSDRKCSM